MLHYVAFKIILFLICLIKVKRSPSSDKAFQFAAHRKCPASPIQRVGACPIARMSNFFFSLPFPYVQKTVLHHKRPQRLSLRRRNPRKIANPVLRKEVQRVAPDNLAVDEHAFGVSPAHKVVRWNDPMETGGSASL
jgi:hypothetical protein